MLSKYNTLPPLYPVSQPFISRFSVHAVGVYEPPGDAPANGYDDLKRPAYTAWGHHLFSGCFSRSLLVRKDALSLPQLRKLAAPLRNPRVRGIGSE